MFNPIMQLHNSTPRNLEEYELQFLSEEPATTKERDELQKDTPRGINCSYILGEQLSTATLAEQGKEVGRMSYQENVDILTSIMKQKTVPEKDVSYFAGLMVYLRLQTFSALPLSAMTISGIAAGFGFRDPIRLIKLVENEGKHNVEYIMLFPIFDLQNLEKGNIANIEVKYTFSQDRTIQLSMGTDNLEYKNLCEKLFVAVTSARYFKPAKTQDPYSLLGFDCNQLVLARQNGYLLSHAANTLRQKKSSQAPEEKEQPTTEVKASLKEQAKEVKGTLTDQVVKRIEEGLKKIGDKDITALARSIDKYGEKNNFKDGAFKTENSDIYNALSPQAKAKIDKIGEKLSDNRNPVRKIIDYLKLIFCKTLDQDIVLGLTAKPTIAEKQGSERQISTGQWIL